MHLRGAIGLATIVASVGAAGAFAQANTPRHEVVRYGAWKATFSYEKTSGGALAAYSHLHLTVSDAGKLVLDKPVTSRIQGASELEPGGFLGHPSITFRDLDGDTSPELLLSLYTGGAHCCFVEQVFDFAAATPRKSELALADSGERLVTEDGQVLLRSADDAFAYEFTDYAESGVPITLWRYSSGRFVNVTRDYPKLVAADAARWWKAYLQQAKRKSDVRGILAAWAADQALRGRAAAAKKRLLQIAAKGPLAVATVGGPAGTAYVRALWRFLEKEHYLR